MMTICLSGLFQFVKGQAPADLVSDKDGNRYKVKIMADHNLWLMQNLNSNVGESYCHSEKPARCTDYGRLYTFQAAVKACAMLGEGWRLPTNAEWATMATHYGGVRDQSVDGGKTAYKTLLMNGKSGFNAQLGGNRESDGKAYARFQAHGLYWTATDNGHSQAWFYNFGAGSEILNRHEDGNKQLALSVRCIRAVPK